MQRTRQVAALAALGAALAWTYAGVFRSLVGDWGLDDDYSHGFLILPIAAYLAYEKRVELQAAERRPSWTGLAVLAASLVLFAAGTMSSQFLARISFVGAVAGATLFVFGPAHARILRFPIAFLVLMVPPPGVLFNQATFSLQLLASSFGETMLTAAGVPVFREGNVLALPHITLSVAEACSGIRSLMSLGTIAILYAWHTVAAPRGQVLLVAATVPLALGANGLRVAATGIVAHHYGEAAALGVFHTFSGFAVLAVSFAGLVAIRRTAVWLLDARAQPRLRAPEVQPW